MGFRTGFASEAIDRRESYGRHRTLEYLFSPQPYQESTMENATRDYHEELGSVEFSHESDGSVTARDTETGLARGGDTRAEALSQLAEVLALHQGDGEPVTDADLREFGLDPDDVDDKPLPEFMQ